MKPGIRLRRTAALTLALVVPLALATACGSGADADASHGTVTVWAHQGQAGESAALRDAVTAFNASQQETRVELTLIPDADYTKAVTATDASRLPDVLEFDGPTMASLVRGGKLAPVDGYVSAGTLANATDATRTDGAIGGRQYGLGMYDSGLGVYGSRKLLDAAGVTYPTGLSDAWTAAEFTDAVRKLAAKDSRGTSLDLQENLGYANEWGTYGFAPVVWSAGGSLLDGGRAQSALNTPAAASALRIFQSWKKYTDPNTDGNAFTKGRAALSWAGHWMYPAYSEALGDDLVVLPLPDFGDGPKTGQGSWRWGISSRTGAGRAAGAFLDALLDDTNVTAMTLANSAPPATRSALARSGLPAGAARCARVRTWWRAGR
ncbi:ABC transporter substrate-binding protein, partial [Streptomyces solincola]|uniref:ABC transporter substrate-binding protein n=1 Tax=Streptomyces solincola TaxID=2100817 RepID=UPI0021590DDE